MKMRLLLVAECMVIVLLVGIVALFLFIKYTRNNIMDGPGMVNVGAFEYLSYSCGGGEFGSIHRLTIRDEELDYTKCEGNGAETINKLIPIDWRTYNKIMTLLSEGDVRKWTNLPKKEYFADDEVETDFEVRFEDGLTIRVANDDIPPSEGWEKIKEIVEILDELATNEE